jgi:hypothetical protein
MIIHLAKSRQDPRGYAQTCEQIPAERAVTASLPPRLGGFIKRQLVTKRGELGLSAYRFQHCSAASAKRKSVALYPYCHRLVCQGNPE